MTSYSDDIELVFVELPKFKKRLEVLDNLSDKWIYFLSNANKLESVPTSMEQEPAINHAFQVAQQSQLTRDELETLEQQAKVLYDYQNSIAYAEQKSREEGKQEAALEIARQLLDVLDLETIALKTGLSLEVLRSL